MAVLLWKPFSDDAKPPRWFPKGRRRPPLVDGKVTVTAFVNGWCLGRNLVYEPAKRAAADLGDDVVFQEIDTSDRSTVAEWGYSDTVLVDGKQLQQGPPPSLEKIRAAMRNRVRRLERHDSA